MLRIVISGGGTGGHVYPAIGIAKELMQLDAETEVIFIGGANRLESTLVPQHRFRFLPISVAGFPRKLTWQWIPVICRVCSGFAKSLWLLKNLKPSVVVGTGGYVCGPVLLAAVLLGVPIVIQEQNAAPGLTNRILARWAKTIYLAFETAARHFPADRTMVTGNPIRRTIGMAARTRGIYDSLGLDPERKTVFVMGGSQGAQAINQNVADALEDLASVQQHLQFVHQTGKADYEVVKTRYQQSSLRHVVQPYFDPIETIYSIADLMVCRAGGMTIAEITACGIPAIFIPLPTAAGDHQRLNAQAVTEAGGALVLDQPTLTGRKLANEIIRIMDAPEEQQRMASQSRQLGNPHAGEEIAQSVISLVKHNP
jgi:UDP-N-acetylglucosamine--N-acetylmuramyl-(pentapeptide) pyrophosphoryl-undecaprenol N-acetylglucosamine transferase